MTEQSPQLGSMIRNYFSDGYRQVIAGWDRFWFSPADPATLGVIRILAGSMLVYTHLIWLWSSNAFFGPAGWLPSATVRLLESGSYAWSHLHWWSSPLALTISHLFAITAALALTLGIWTRPAAIIACLMTISYNNRVPGALYGLDQVNAFLAFYLAIGPSGACYSLDRWFKTRAARVAVNRSVSANLAIRLIQLHLCVIYLFAGLSKLQGATWWDGTAFWGGIASLEYQSLDMTWLVDWPLTVNLITHVTVFWELSYSALIWNRLTRPIVLAMAVIVHAGIALAMGMKTFGFAMIFANLAFVSPQFIRALLRDRSAVALDAREDHSHALRLSQPAETTLELRRRAS